MDKLYRGQTDGFLFRFQVKRLPADQTQAARSPRQFVNCLHDQFRRRAASALDKRWKASVNKPSPANKAIPSPKTLWGAGAPRRKSSSSRAGKSSWISESTGVISTAQAKDNKCAPVPRPTIHPRPGSGSDESACRQAKYHSASPDRESATHPDSDSDNVRVHGRQRRIVCKYSSKSKLLVACAVIVIAGRWEPKYCR